MCGGNRGVTYINDLAPTFMASASIGSANYTWKIFGKKYCVSQVPIAHACNPSYSGDRDQEDHGLSTAWANRLRDPVSKNPPQKSAGERLK
jgi:hypothetical protein